MSAEENGNADGESSDDLLPSPPVSNIGQRCGSMLSAQPKVFWASVTDSRASGFIDLAQPSTSTDLNIPELSVSSKNTKNGTNYKPNFKVLNCISQESSSSVELHGVKRKFGGNHFQIQKRKRRKTYHCKNTKTELKRKHASDHSDTGSKRFKSEHTHEIGSHSDTDATASCSRLTSPTDETSDKEEESEDDQPCPRSCVCQAGPSKLPLFLERKFDTPAPLYKACLLRRIYSLSNTQYMCCKKRCVKKLSRERVMKVCLFHMEEDYYKSDLSVHSYKWGEWKD